MKKFFLFLLVVGVVGGSVYYWYAVHHSETMTPSTSVEPIFKKITFATTTLTVEVVATDTMREEGLSGRNEIGSDAMLFVFDQDGSWGIWMKDMTFSIDILWLAADGTVITVVPNAAPETYPKAFYPTAPARYVLELPAGYAAVHGIGVGTKFVL